MASLISRSERERECVHMCVFGEVHNVHQTLSCMYDCNFRAGRKEEEGGHGRFGQYSPLPTEGVTLLGTQLGP